MEEQKTLLSDNSLLQHNHIQMLSFFILFSSVFYFSRFILKTIANKYSVEYISNKEGRDHIAIRWGNQSFRF